MFSETRRRRTLQTNMQSLLQEKKKKLKKKRRRKRHEYECKGTEVMKERKKELATESVLCLGLPAQQPTVLNSRSPLSLSLASRKRL